MAVHGVNTRVYLGGIDLSPYLNSMDLSAELDTADTTMFAATWKSEIAGTLGSSVSFTGGHDVGETVLTDTLLALTPGVLTYCPGGGSANSDRARLVSAQSVAWQSSSPVGGLVAISGSFQSTDAVGFGDVLHPLAEDTNTTTGAGKDDTAASATGWTAHLHVTAVDGGSWVIRLQDATISDFSDVADVAGGAFTAATAATSQRLQSATTTTALRRRVRYVATRTGGSAGDGITFHLSYARNR